MIVTKRVGGSARPEHISELAFTPAVKAQHEAHGPRAAYAKQLDKRDWQSTIAKDLTSYLAERNSFYSASVSEDGHPDIQHRGGPNGFLKVLDEQTLAFAVNGGAILGLSCGVVVLSWAA